MEPSAEFDRDIHQRLLVRDPIASSELATAYLEPLIGWLQNRFRDVPDEHLIADAATDTLLDYIENPTRFNPAKSRLRNYLRMAARRDLLNILQKEKRRAKGDQRIQQEMRRDAVELRPKGGNISQEENERTVAGQNLKKEIFEVITDSRDRQLLQLILDGERRTHVYAEILEIRDHDELTQRRVVKRHKDRLKKRLERLGVKLRESTSR